MGLLTELVLVTVLCYSMASEIIGYCTLISEDKQTCDLIVECWTSTEQLQNTIKNEYCTEREHNRHYYYTGPLEYTRAFQIDLKVNDVILELLQPYTDRDQLLSHVKILRLDKGNIVTIPEQITSFEGLKEIEIRHAKLDVIEITIFLSYGELQKIDLSSNSISLLNKETQESLKQTSQVTTIDLSHNLILTIPHNYFSNFPELRHLYLSHNQLSSVDVPTFEGLLKLQTLHLSYNNLKEIGHTFVRFINLNELLLNNNMFSSIDKINFVAMTNLQRLNLSSNKINLVEDRSFETLVALAELDVSNNVVPYVSSTWFPKKHNLHTVILSGNNITTIEPYAFKGGNVTVFAIENNNLTGQLQAGTFEGIHVKHLDLSKENLTIIKDNAFSSSYFLSLNLSFNSLTTIEKNAFGTLDMIEELDLSHNFLRNIEFEMVDSSKITLFTAKNNSIDQIKISTFKNLSSISYLDLSYNLITKIQPQSFTNLRNLNTLLINNNPMPNTLQRHLFEGLDQLTFLNLAYTNIVCFDNQTFFGLNNLQIINASHGELINLNYNAFENTNSIETLDLSHNGLENFQLNTSNIRSIQEIYLNNNRLAKITSSTFDGLHYLRTLKLTDNNIARIDHNAFDSLIKLGSLDLSSNHNLQINGRAFKNLKILSKLNLTLVPGKFDFQDASNTSVEILDLSQCNIEEVNKILIFKLVTIVSLNLAANKITFLDKYSFQTMPFLTWLDLSNNLISYIQPGTFIHTKKIVSLNLHGNQLPYLQFGVLDGLEILHTLNLSRNSLHSFGINLLHTNPMIDTVALDNNALKDINFKEFHNTRVKVLSIGGNQISCHKITDEVKSATIFHITAEVKDYHSENVQGITCKSNSPHNSSDTKINSTVTVNDLSSVIDNLRASIDKFSNTSVANEPKMSIPRLLHKLIESTNFSQGLLKNITDVNMQINNHWIENNQIHKDERAELFDSLQKIINLLKNISHIDMQTNYQVTENIKRLNGEKNRTIDSPNKIETKIENLTNTYKQTNNHFMEHIKVVNDKKDEIAEELKTIREFKQTNQAAQASTFINPDYYRDIKGILCFIAVCLAVNTIGIICKFVYPFLFPKHRLEPRLNYHNSVTSTQPIASDIEMH